MFEFEVSPRRSTDNGDIPAEIVEDICSQVDEVEGMSILPWEEHCTECAMPACFETCSLYEPRKDGKCRRFVEGIQRVEGIPGVLGYMVKVTFKRWGQLMAYGNARLVPIDVARKVERGIAPLEQLAAATPDGQLPVLGRRGVSSRLLRRLKQSVAGHPLIPALDDGPPDYFLAEVYNPGPEPVRLSVRIKNGPRPGEANGTDPQEHLPFQELLEVETGFNRFRIDCGRIMEFVDLESPFSITLNPNLLGPEDAGLELWFGAITFVRATPDEAPSGVGDADATEKPESGKTKHVKIVAWDLDNTVWEGTLIEDGPEGIELRPGIAEVIRTLDRRGIVNTVVSKNNEWEGMEQLERFGLSEYMVFPKISWDPKSVALQELVNEFNVGEDTFAFVDDSPFERNEVKSRLPGIRVFGAEDCCSLPELTDFQPPESSESSKRREFYQSQHRRKQARATYDGDYESFLERCDIRLMIERGGFERLDRIDELVQRTNQLNFSGNRYSKEQVSELLSDDEHECYVMRCSDNFGEYGTVGFAIVETANDTLSDMMFSCRVQGKRVEHAFLKFLLARAAEAGKRGFHVRYFQTERNKPAGRVFDDLDFELASEEGNTKKYRFDLEDRELDPEPVSVFWEGAPWEP